MSKLDNLKRNLGRQYWRFEAKTSETESIYYGIVEFSNNLTPQDIYRDILTVPKGVGYKKPVISKLERLEND